MPLPVIESPKNPRIVAAAKLLDRKTRARTGLFLIEGWRLVRTALQAEAAIEELYITRETQQREGAGMMIASLLASNVPVFEAGEAAVKRLSETVTPQGIAAVARRVDARFEDLRLGPRPLILLADAVADPGNFGSLARIAAAAGAGAIIALPDCCDWTSPKVLRASAGNVFHVPIVRAPLEAALMFLRGHNLPLAATIGAGGDSIYETDLSKGLALVFGNEANGVSEEVLSHADLRLTIPMPGPVESLNVTAAAAIAVFEAVRQRRLKKRG